MVTWYFEIAIAIEILTFGFRQTKAGISDLSFGHRLSNLALRFYSQFLQIPIIQINVWADWRVQFFSHRMSWKRQGCVPFPYPNSKILEI